MNVPIVPMTPDPIAQAWSRGGAGAASASEDAAAASGHSCVDNDPELRKDVRDRKNFDRRLSKYSNEHGEKEFKDWVFEL